MNRSEQIIQLKKQVDEINQKIAELGSVKIELCERTNHFISYTNSGCYVNTHYFKTESLKNRALHYLDEYMKLLNYNSLYDNGYKFCSHEKNYYIKYNALNSDFEVDYSLDQEVIGTIYFSNEIIAKEALAMLQENE